MKKIFLLVMCIATPIFSYEHNMLNLTVPSKLEAGFSVFDIEHRFYGRVDNQPIDTFFGIDAGANMKMSSRYCWATGWEVKVSHVRAPNQYTVGLSYVPEILPIQIDVELISTKVLERINTFYYSLSKQKQLLPYLSAAVNLGYDAAVSKAGAGLGLEFQMMSELYLMGEYYPSNQVIAKDSAFAIGMRYETFGHNFMLMVQNSTDVGPRRLMQGTLTPSDFYLGFNIHRLLSL